MQKSTTYDCMLQFAWLFSSNLFEQRIIAWLCWNLFLTSAPDCLSYYQRQNQLKSFLQKDTGKFEFRFAYTSTYIMTHLQHAEHQNCRTGAQALQGKGVFLKKWTNPGLFFVYFRSFQTNIKMFTTNICEKISIQYTVPGFEPTTFGMWVSSHNH